ncbi:MAG: RluA family pseudouridine synthase [Clostridia bacterium]|nr:RluA family pseudouridine synthase [Clostridia bacterium]
MNILFVDDAIVVAIKPAGVLSQEGEAGSLPAKLKEELGGEIYCVHRLDRETAGVMVFARSQKAAATLSQDIALRKFEKEYLAVVTGTLEEAEGSLSDLLFFHRKKGKVFPVKRERKGVKDALLHYSVLESDGAFSLVRVTPVTGRTHQIRVQFASRKHPLFGDRKYGGGHGTLGLFSNRITFSHPISGERLSFNAFPEHGEPWAKFDLHRSEEA